MSAFIAKYDTLVNELRTKIKVLPHDAPESSAIELTCLWDTGAQFSVITPRIAEILGLDAVDLKKAYTANGIYETPVYRLDTLQPLSMLVRRIPSLKKWVNSRKPPREIHVYCGECPYKDFGELLHFHRPDTWLEG